MKRIFSLVLTICVLISFTSCGNNDTNDAKFGFSPPIKGLYWGMPADKAIEKLNLSKNNISTEDHGKWILLSYENTKILNEKANVRMFFDTGISNVGLFKMEVTLVEPDRNKLIKRLSDDYGKFVAVDNNSKPCRWESKDKVSSLSEEMQTRMKTLLIPKKTQITSNDAEWDNLQKQALTTVSLDENMIIYSAKHAAFANIISDDEAYNEIIAKISELNKK